MNLREKHQWYEIEGRHQCYDSREGIISNERKTGYWGGRKVLGIMVIASGSRQEMNHVTFFSWNQNFQTKNFDSLFEMSAMLEFLSF